MAKQSLIFLLIWGKHNNNTVLSNNKSLIFHAVTIMSILILAIFRIEFSFLSSPSFDYMKYIACRVQSKCLVSLFEFLRFLWHHTTSNIYQPFHTRILGSELNRRLSVMKYFEVYWISMPNLNSIIYLKRLLYCLILLQN